jgi:hypothetical protein
MSISSTESARSDDFKIKDMAADPEHGMDYAAWTMSNMDYFQTLQDLNPIGGKKEVPVRLPTIVNIPRDLTVR